MKKIISFYTFPESQDELNSFVSRIISQLAKSDIPTLFCLDNCENYTPKVVHINPIFSKSYVLEKINKWTVRFVNNKKSISDNSLKTLSNFFYYFFICKNLKNKLIVSNETNIVTVDLHLIKHIEKLNMFLLNIKKTYGHVDGVIFYNYLPRNIMHMKFIKDFNSSFQVRFKKMIVYNDDFKLTNYNMQFIYEEFTKLFLFN